MQFFNTSKFPALYFAHRNATGRRTWVVVARATFDITKDGELSRVEPQPKVNFEERADGDLTCTSIQHESDIAPEKPKVDVIVNANAYAPNDEPAQRFDVGLAVSAPEGASGNLDSRLCTRLLTVTGPREWRRRSGLGRAAASVANAATLTLLDPGEWSLTEPSAAKSVPLRYELAYGGTVRLDDETTPNCPPLACAFPRNPVGRGYVPSVGEITSDHSLTAADAKSRRSKWADRVDRFPAPQIELPNQPLGPIDQHYPLAGWGTVPKHWAPRLDRAGTFDDTWQAERHPLLPHDFDPLYWNGAHPDLQLDHVPNDAIIDLWRLVPATRKRDQLLRIRLPGLALTAEVLTSADTEPRMHALRMDTVHIDLLEDRLTLLYRLGLPCAPAVLYAHIDTESYQ